jgi:hypothetical protein
VNATPGPWEKLTFSNHELQTDFAMVRIGERVHMIGYSEEDVANARLIAAAPGLITVIQNLLDYPKENWAFAQARAAIRAATGGQS